MISQEPLTPDEAWEKYHVELEQAATAEVYGDPDSDRDNKEPLPHWMEEFAFKWTWQCATVYWETRTRELSMALGEKIERLMD